MRKCKVNIFIPYKLQGNGQELRLALRSIEQNCKFYYDVIISGDCPEWIDKQKIIHVNPKFQPTADYPKAWNVINKVRHFIMESGRENLLLTYDDIIFLTPVTYSQIQKTIATARLPKSAMQLDGTSSNTWKQIMQYTIDALERNHLPNLNYETHLPRLFNAAKLKETFEHFRFQKRPYMYPTLYFNWIKQVSKPIILSEIPDQKIKAGIYFAGDFEKYSPVLDKYMYLNWSEKFWSPELENCLLAMFPTPSNFEKQ